MKRRVADIIMDTLVELGVTDCFAVVGGGAMHLDNALLVCEDMHKYFNHHEQACAMAAEAYAKACGKMAAVCVTSGPGATNTLTGVMGAWQDSIPMFVLSGQVRYEISVPKSGLNLRYRGIQEYQIVPAVQHMTKYAKMITDPKSIRAEVVKAYRIAMDGRKGPVWLDIPQDIQNATVEEAELLPIADERKKEQSLDSILRHIYQDIQNAERPCILAGSGITSAWVREEFEQLVNKLGIPVIGGAWVADNFYMEHPLYYGPSGNIGPRTGNFILQNADYILVLGNSLGFRQTGFNQEAFAPHAKICMVDVDQEEPRKPGLHIAENVYSDLRDFLPQMLVMDYKVSGKDEWIAYCDRLKNRFTPFEAIKDIDMHDRVCSYYFWKVFQKYENADSVLALGNNTANTAKLQIGVQKSKQRALTNYTCGSMGYDLPAAIGAAVALKREIICVTGDGSIMMNLQELQTIKGYHLPVKVVVFENNGYNAIRQTSKNFFNGASIGCSPDTGVSFPNFEKIANAFEYEYRCCNSNEELDDSLQWLFENSGFLFLEVKQRLDDPVIPKVMSRLDSNGKMQTPALEDMYPFLTEEEHKSLMYW